MKKCFLVDSALLATAFLCVLAVGLLLVWSSGAEARGHVSSYRAYSSHSYRSYTPRTTSRSYRSHTPRSYRSYSHRSYGSYTPRSYSTARASYSSTHGRIHRSEAAKRTFLRQTGYPHGRPGYVVDHIVPLARGGTDAPSNMQWQTVAEAKAKDKWELGPRRGSHARRRSSGRHRRH
jgi:hypothetical protein